MAEGIALKRMHQALILVVDDAELNRKVLTHSLKSNGFTNIVTAVDGQHALQVMEESMPDIVILDLMMPGMDGFRYCEVVRGNKAYDHIPIIVQTALSETEQKLRAFQLGASDYICKPIDPGELNARVRAHLNQRLLTEDLRAYHERVSKELEAARRMQNRLMPGAQQLQAYERLFDMRIASYFETCSVLGGDCWGMRALSDTCLAVYMFDFSGHGMTAALNVFRMHTMMQDMFQACGEAGTFLCKLNRFLYPLLERDDFATMFYGIIDAQANSLSYASAGALPPLLFGAKQVTALALEGRGFPLGALPNATYDTHYTAFAPGDMLLLHSDGLVETASAQGEFLSERQLMETGLKSLGEQAQNPAQHIIERLLDMFHAHAAAPLNDDITLAAYWRNNR